VEARHDSHGDFNWLLQPYRLVGVGG
jgi:hypothetical protein